MKKIFNLLLFSVIFTSLSQGTAVAAGLCAEKIEPNYVNLMMINDTFGAGLDDVFEVVIQRVRPKTEAELEKLKAFYYVEGKDEFGYAYPDGREYRWQLENNEYRLYKLVKGKEPQRIELFKAAFPATKKFLYQLRLLKSNPRVYKELGLDKKLDSLGLMGVIFRGGRGTLDFINSVNVMASGLDTPKVVVKNANTVLYRYALASGFEGATRQVAYDEFHGTLGYKILMERMSEQEILDNYYGELLTAAGEKDDRYDIVNTFKDLNFPAVNINGINQNEIKYIYMPCKAAGNDTYGSPKAAFLPVKIADDKGSSFYPVFVFPAAFSNLESLNKSIRRELYHARWWNAAANLPHQPVDAKSLVDPSLKREAFLRQATPQIELEIFEKQKEDPQYAEYQQMYASFRLLLHDQLKSVTESPEKLQFNFPWTVSTALIKPNGMYGPSIDDMLDDIGSRYYNKVFARAYKTMDDFTIRHSVPNKFPEKTRKELADGLINSLVHGYSLTRENRGAKLGMVTSYKPLYLGYFDGMDMYRPGWKWAEDRETAFALVNSVGAKGYGFGDLEWDFKLVQALWFSHEPFYKRFDYLVNTAKVMEISGLADVSKEPFVINADQEIADVKILLDSMEGKGKKALQKIVNNASMEADKKIAKQKEIEGLNDEIAAHRIQLEKSVDDLKKANTAYLDALDDYNAKTESAYTAMTGQCVNSMNYKPAKSMKSTHIYNQYLNVLEVKSAECTSAIDSFINVRDNADSLNNLWTLYEAEADKRSNYDTLASMIDEVDALLNQAVMTEKPIDKKLASDINAINKSKKKAFKTWGEYSRAAFMEYFSDDSDDKAAFEALERKLKVINGVSIVKGGAQ